MNDIAHAAAEGFVAPFVLAAAIVVSVVGGVWRVSSRLASAFVHNRPIPISPNKSIKLP